MAFAKRIFLFVLTNILILTTITIVLRLTGLDQYLNYYGQSYGLNYQALLVFCLVWGMAGSFISLLLSRVIAKWSMGVKIIDPATADANSRELISIVHNLAKGAGISTMPQVGIYNSPEVNAFATGPTKNRSLVAVSSGLLQRMYRPELEGVLGHEVAHIANGDMVTMTLVQGVINAFVMFFARVLAFLVTSAMSRDNERPNHMINFALVMVFQILFGFLGMMVVGYYSRIREYSADRDGAKLAGRPKMIAALEALKNHTGLIARDDSPVAAFKINGRARGMMALLSTHPPLEDRIMRLKTMTA
jgi:heat shock protein HtpX